MQDAPEWAPGERKSRAPNGTPEGRKEDRRAEVQLVSNTGQPTQMTMSPIRAK